MFCACETLQLLSMCLELGINLPSGLLQTKKETTPNSDRLVFSERLICCPPTAIASV
jgi:hypothetical protein